MALWSVHWTPGREVWAREILGRVTLRWTGIPFRGGVVRLLVASYQGNRDELRLGGALGSSTHFAPRTNQNVCTVQLMV